MKIKLANGAIAESHNELVINQWKKRGYEDVSEKEEVTEKPAVKASRKKKTESE